MRRLVHGLTAAVGLLVVAVAVPWMLIEVAGWPLPTRPPNWSNVYWAARQNHVPAEFVVKSLAVVAWLAWAQVMWAVVWEIVVNVPRTLRGERAVAAPGSLGISGRAARALVAPLMFLTSFASSAPTAAAPSLGDLSSSSWFGAAAGPVPAVVDYAPSAAAAPRWTVQPGDTLWDVAERCLGDGSRVDDVLACNPNITATSRLRPGESLRLPPDAVVAPQPALRTDQVDQVDPETVHVVRPGDTLWSIAEAELHDPLRWPDVYDANAGRTFGDGRTFDDPDLIVPGWDLSIPAVDRVDTAAPPATLPAETIPAERPEPTGMPSEMPTGHAMPASPSTTDPADDPTLVTSLPAPDGDPAGPPSEPVVSPPASAPPASAPQVAATSTLPLDPAGDGALPVGPAPSPTSMPNVTPRSVPPARADGLLPEPAAADLRPVNRWSEAAVPGEAGLTDDAAGEPAPEVDASGVRLLTMERAAMMSAGVLLLLGVRRRQRLRAAAAGARRVVAPHSSATVERALRSIAPGERFARVDLSVRAAALQLIRYGRRPLAVLAADDGTIELVANGPVDLGAPWEGAGSRWTLPGSVPIELLAPDARRVAAPTPTLVQLGCDGTTDVYVDLEAIGALQVDGPPHQADAVVCAIATTLATSVLAEVTTLVGVGVPDAAFCGHRHHAVADDLPAGLAAAIDAIGSTVAATMSTFELRARATGGETWEPAVVLVGSGDEPRQLPFVPSGVAVVSATPLVGPSAVLAPDGDAWVLRPAGIRVLPVGLDAGDVEALAALLDVPGWAPTDLDTDLDPDLDADRTVAVAAESPAILVRLIGPVRVEVAGSPVEFERSKTRELIAWLATHRERSTRTLARTALWESDVRDATFANVVSEARRALARAVAPLDGEEWVGRTMTEELPLHPAVRTDAEVLETALAAARSAAPAEAVDLLQPAVELLAGMPFEGTSFLWPDPEGITSSLVLLATSAACELAAQYLALGDTAGVFAATERGLRVLPGHEELIGLRMQAHARTGDHAGVRHEWETYLRTVVADPWSDGEPSPKLVDLLGELLNAPS